MNAALNVFIFYLLHVALTVGLFCLFGVVIAACNKLFYASLGNKSRLVCYATGFIGTPIHELSHALMCLIFRHKITEIKLFQINSADGVLGYVNHTYNPRNIYQHIGNFFIGIAPVLVGFLILTGLFYLLLPEVFNACVGMIGAVNWTNGVGGFFGILTDLFGVLFDCFGMWQWWVFVIVGSFIALHMTLSKADWKGAFSGIHHYCSCEYGRHERNDSWNYVILGFCHILWCDFYRTDIVAGNLGCSNKENNRHEIYLKNI